MVINLSNLCRLCAKNKNTEINVNSTVSDKFNLKELISTYFSIIISDEDRTSKKVCNDCYEFMEKLVKFNESVEKANQMFLEFLSNGNNQIELSVEFQEKYGLFESIKSECIDEIEMREKLDVVSNKIESREHISVSVKTENSDDDDDDDTIDINKITTSIKNFRDNNKDDIVECKIDDNISTGQNTTNNDAIVVPKKAHYIMKNKKPKKQIIGQPCECSFCNKVFFRRRYLQEHIKNAHSELTLECTTCHKKFGTKSRLTKHELVHIPYDQRYSCSYCDKKFTSPALKRHISRVHLGERPYICEECGKAFGTKGNLMGHMYTHNTKTIYKCSHCDKEFRNKICLQVHEDIHSKNIYTCSKCGAQLKTKNTLNIHMSSVHSDIKKYKCDRCGMGFKAYNELKHHLISHLGLKPYSCQFCDKSFTNTKNCRIHVNKIHANEIAALESTGSSVVKIKSNIPSMDQLKTLVKQTSVLQP